MSSSSFQSPLVQGKGNMLICLQILQHGDAGGEGSGRYGGIGGPCKTQDFLRVYPTLGLALLEGTSRLKG